MGHRSWSCSRGRRLYNVAANAVGQAARIEIQNQPDMQSAHAQIGMQLCLMRRQDGSDSLDLENHLACDDDIGPEALADRQPLYITGIGT